MYIESETQVTWVQNSIPLLYQLIIIHLPELLDLRPSNLLEQIITPLRIIILHTPIQFLNYTHPILILYPVKEISCYLVSVVPIFATRLPMWG